ncbi:hypothetical protein HDR58_02870 [bacterium]|nr:hypothetical protein [bacterium]
MGLATAQARFLGITARKAACEYKSTEIAQQKLEITNQLSGIAADYANAMNSTKLIWQNDAVTYDYGVTYGLLMTPSSANDYNPYLITTSSGAIVLNSEYAAAAKAAGISKAGGFGSQDSRDKFIAALVPGGIITQDSANAITQKDYLAVKNADGSINLTDFADVQGSEFSSNVEFVEWNSSAGMGAVPMDKASIDAMDLSAMILSESIGKQPIDWTQLYIDKINKSAGVSEDNKKISKIEYEKELAVKNDNIKKAQSEYNNMADGTTKNNYKVYLEGLMQDKEKYIAKYKDKLLDFNSDASSYFQTSESKISNKFTVVRNGVINKSDLADMTIGDILANDIVLIQKNTDNSENGLKEQAKEFSDNVSNLLEYIAEILGMGQPVGVGLNVDDASAKALNYAFEMAKKQFLKPDNKISTGSKNSDNSMKDNSAFLNASQNNRIAQAAGYTAVSLSNLLSAFLTYYDNSLNGNNSNFVVGKSLDTTSYVTDARDYMYIGKTTSESVSQEQKLADFYDQIYNNICEHGWREDATVEDYEYLANAIKNGRYSMSSLNNDGYYYQTRYNETGYLVEVTDDDAIARAEAEYTQKKAELTYKEDSIDMKSKKLDAEISSLSTEYDTVKNLISKNIEKTFTIFSS